MSFLSRSFTKACTNVLKNNRAFTFPRCRTVKIEELKIPKTKQFEYASTCSVSWTFRPGAIEINPVSLPRFNHEVPFNKFELPVYPNTLVLEMPALDGNLIEKTDLDHSSVPKSLPGREEDSFEKLAHKMLRIRRRKMKKHQRKKLWKKMRFVWEKRRMRNEQRKERIFQEYLAMKIANAEKFNAEEYVASRIRLAEQVVELRPKRPKYKYPIPEMNPV